ncbi:positive regulation of cilium movement [Tritrichomonas musculus]|uniref:Positive regulation of cilium movement n=1 Tax=Tritrichomonas musculus TaxID=1915356 RepID=A0ABR2IM59_9EUKA
MKPSPNEGCDVDVFRTKYKTSKDALKAAGLIFKNAQTEAILLSSKAIKNPHIYRVYDPLTSKEDDFPDFVWIDGFITRDEANTYAPWQRINKVPGMDYICYKSTLFLELNKMKKLFPDIYTKAYPTAFLLPNDYSEFQCEHKKLVGLVTNVKSDSSNSTTPTWVVKPRNGCCGHGITLIQSTYEASDILEQSVCQLYISPYLINQRKFDFRLYILVASLEPLTFFIYNEGIARFCTDPYEPPSRSNRDKKYCHLTNTAINKENGSINNPADFTKKFTEIMATICQRNPQKGKMLYAKICDVSRAVILGVLPMMLGSLPRKDDMRPVGMHGSLRSRSFSPDQKMKRKVIIPRPSPSNGSTSNSQVSHSHQTHQKNTILEKLPPPNSNTTTVSSEPSKTPSTNDNNNSNDNNNQKTAADNGNTSVNANSNENANTNNDNKSNDNSNNANDNSSNNNNNDTTAKVKVGKQYLKPSKRYFHILGIDILLNEDLEPYVLELNDRPSLSVTVPFEEDLKVKLMRDTFFHVYPTTNPAPQPQQQGEQPSNELLLVATDNEESDWTQIFPLPESAAAANANTSIHSKNSVNGFSNISFFTKEQWKEVLRKASIPAHHSSSVASTNATNRMASSGINEALHQERRQRFNEIRESTKGIKFNLY